MLLRNKSLHKSSLQESCHILKDLPSPAIADSQLKGQEIQVGNAQAHWGPSSMQSSRGPSALFSCKTCVLTQKTPKILAKIFESLRQKKFWKGQVLGEISKGCPHGN